MLFNSFIFAVFFPIVLVLYWIVPFRLQNILLLAASYVFYGYWDWRFLSLIAISTIVDYISGLKLEAENIKNDAKSPKRKKFWVTLSIVVNLGLLGFFKYYNFFVSSFEDMMAEFGVHMDPLYLSIILPIGISFYTFQTMSYTIDIYKGNMKPTKRFFDFALYVAFFPQLVAGPIERAKALLPRILKKREFNANQFMEGVHLIFWGLFKKVYVADNLAPMVDRYFAMSNLTSFEALIASYGFVFQVYCDFSGYSDIARGCAKCLGIELMLNFNHPFVAINPGDFWKRWHISLSSWLRDYLYISLGGSRVKTWKIYRNLIITMLLGGLWHGAAWTYVVWGAYHGAILIGYRLLRPVMARATWFRETFSETTKRVVKVLVVFHLILLAHTIFRTSSVLNIWDMISPLFIWKGSIDWSLSIPLLQYIVPLILFEAIFKSDWNKVKKVHLWGRSLIYGSLFYLLAMHGATQQSFIYFQF